MTHDIFAHNWHALRGNSWTCICDEQITTAVLTKWVVETEPFPEPRAPRTCPAMVLMIADTVACFRFTFGREHTREQSCPTDGRNGWTDCKEMAIKNLRHCNLSGMNEAVRAESRVNARMLSSSIGTLDMQSCVVAEWNANYVRWECESAVKRRIKKWWHTFNSSRSKVGNKVCDVCIWHHRLDQCTTREGFCGWFEGEQKWKRRVLSEMHQYSEIFPSWGTY